MSVKIRRNYQYAQGPRVMFNGERGVSRTKQSFAEECDINCIVARAAAAGGLQLDARSAQARYGDFSSAPTYQEALNLVLEAQTRFSELGSAVRDRFGNDASRFLEFASDRKNLKELVAMGLAVDKTPKPDVSAPVKDPSKVPPAAAQ